MLGALALGAVLGAAGGVGVRAVLARWDYRLEDEQHLPRRSLAWVVPTSTVVCALLAVFHRDDPVTLAVLLGAAVVAVLLAAVDVDVHRLPDVVQLPAYPVLAAALLLAALVSDAHTVGDWVRALLAGVVAAAAYLVLAIVGRGQLGLGDVKLAGLIGMLGGWFSWSVMALMLAAGPFVGALVGVVLIAGRRATRKSFIPFGPPMMVGALLVGLLA